MCLFFGSAGKFFPVLLLVFFLIFFPAWVNGHDADFLFDDEFYDDDYLLEFDEESSLTIVGTRQTSQQMVRINREEIEQSGARDLAGLLQDALALNIPRYGGYGNQTSIHLRGFSSSRIAFLIDGIPANSAMDGGFDLNQIDLNSIELIEVIYGGSDSRFNVSGALGGVINIITLGRQEAGWHFNGSVSNTSALPRGYRGRDGLTQSSHWEDFFDAQNISVSAAYGSGAGFSFCGSIFANRVGNHFVFTDFLGYSRRKDNNEVWDLGANTSLVWNVGAYSKIIAANNFYYGNKNIPSSGFSGYFGTQEDTILRQTIMLEMPQAFHDDLATEASLSWNFARMNYTSPANVLSRHDQNSFSLINRWDWYPSQNLTLRGGVDYRYIWLNSTEIGDRSRHEGGIYLTAEFTAARQFQIIPSFKVMFNDMIIVPKLGLLWNVTGSLTLKNNYFRSFKFPEFQDLYWVSGDGFEGNPNLRSEDGWGGDLGASWSINRQMNLESIFFVQWMRDSIHWSPDSGIWRPENVGQAMFFGLDNRVRFGMLVSIGPVKQMSASLSYKYLRSYLLGFGYTFASDRRIPYNPEHTIGFAVDFLWDRGSVLFSGHYESVRYGDRANLTMLSPYFLLNAVYNQEINSSLTAFAALRNILNSSYESFYDYPMPGISMTLGMRVKL